MLPRTRPETALSTETALLPSLSNPPAPRPSHASPQAGGELSYRAPRHRLPALPTAAPGGPARPSRPPARRLSPEGGRAAGAKGVTRARRPAPALLSARPRAARPQPRGIGRAGLGRAPPGRPTEAEERAAAGGVERPGAGPPSAPVRAVPRLPASRAQGQHGERGEGGVREGGATRPGGGGGDGVGGEGGGEGRRASVAPLSPPPPSSRARAQPPGPRCHLAHPLPPLPAPQSPAPRGADGTRSAGRAVRRCSGAALTGPVVGGRGADLFPGPCRRSSRGHGAPRLEPGEPAAPPGPGASRWPLSRPFAVRSPRRPSSALR